MVRIETAFLFDLDGTLVLVDSVNSLSGMIPAGSMRIWWSKARIQTQAG